MVLYLGTRVSDRTLARQVALQTEHATLTYESMLFSATRIYSELPSRVRSLAAVPKYIQANPAIRNPDIRENLLDGSPPRIVSAHSYFALAIVKKGL